MARLVTVRKAGAGRRGQGNPQYRNPQPRRRNPWLELRVPTAQEVQAVKDELKLAKVPASVRIEKGIKRSYGTMTIRPRGRAYFEMPELVNIVGILTRHGFHVDYPDNLHVHRPGLHYLQKRNPGESIFLPALVEGIGTGAGMAVSAGLLAPLVVDRAAKVFKQLGLIRKNPSENELKGSEKQIKWAANIKTAALSELKAGRANFAAYTERVRDNFANGVPTSTATKWEMMAEVLGEVSDKLNNETSAAWFIDAVRPLGLYGVIKNRLEERQAATGKTQPFTLIKKVF